MSRRRVLLVDDSQLAVEVQTMLLERHGFEVHACFELAEIAGAVTSFAPEVILLDANLGDTTVEDALAALAASSAPVLLYSGMLDDELAALAKRLGVFGHVNKADPPNVVIEKLKAALEAANAS